MSPPTTTTTIIINDNSNFILVNFRRFQQAITSNTINDRWFFLLIHLLFYIIIFFIIYIRLGQFNNKHEKILATYHNLTIQQSEISNHNIDCSCQTSFYPRRNRTTRCLDIYIGLKDMISNVFCPISSHHNYEYNQWFTIQNRQTNQINFNRTWIEYRRGFGDIINQKNFWIGNDNLYWLTNNFQCRLKIELTDWFNETRIGTYELFHISNQNDNYRIQIGGYNGNIEISNRIDSFSRWHYNAPFSTYDHYQTDNINCPYLHGGSGWWYHPGADCAHVQLNGILATFSDGLVPFNTGIQWLSWKIDRHYSFQRVQMSIQPKLKRSRIHH